jgi:uncharacterized protein (TIGR03437 family)
MKRFSIAMPIVWGILSCLPCPGYSQGIINTVTGGPWTFPSGVTSGLNAPLGSPVSVALDAQGDAYFADSLNDMVFELTAQGVFKIVAGNGTVGFSGDGGAATAASLNSPQGVAVDASGNLYIADKLNYRIRKVSFNGVITTVAGNGTGAFAGDGGPATSASLYAPSGVAVDASGNLYIADPGNFRIREVSPSGVISTYAGNGVPIVGTLTGDGGPATAGRISNPASLALDASGNLYFSDSTALRVRKVTAATGVITTVVGGTLSDGLPANSIILGEPEGVAVDASGNLYIADAVYSVITKVSPTGKITSVAGTGTSLGFFADGGPATSAVLNLPNGVAVDSSGNIFIADTGNRRVRKVSATSGIISTLAGNGNYRFSGDGGPAASATMYLPVATAVDSSGNLFIAEVGGARVRKVSSGVISTAAGPANWFAGTSGDGGPATSASFFNPVGVAVDTTGNMFIADGLSGVRKVTAATGVINTVVAATGPPDSLVSIGAYGVAADAAGNLYFSILGQVQELSTSGAVTNVAGTTTGQGGLGDGGPATSASLRNNTGIAVDSSGNLFIADRGNSRIRKVSLNGIITTVAGNGTAGFSGDGGPATSASLNLASYGQLAVDKSGNLFFSDGANNRIRKVSTNGIISTVAGTGAAGFSGDGGPATLASLNMPQGIALDAAGNLFIADYNNNCIRQMLAVTSPSIPAVSANGIVNGASFGSQIVAPGEIVSVFGTNLGPAPGELTSVTGGFLEASHAGVAVTFNGTPAALFYVGNTQINLQVPWEVGTAASTSVLVTAAGQTGSPYTLSLRPIDPAIFISGGRMAILDQTGSQITASHPGSAGAVLSMYATGLGAVNPAVKSGQIAPNGLTPTAATTTVTVGAVNAPVGYAGLAPGFVGLYQVNFTVPSGLASGDQSLVMTTGGVSTAPLPLAVH